MTYDVTFGSAQRLQSSTGWMRGFGILFNTKQEASFGLDSNHLKQMTLALLDPTAAWTPAQKVQLMSYLTKRH